MSAQLSLYEAPAPLDDLRAQFARMPSEIRVLLDAMLAIGAKLDVLGDADVEAERLKRAATTGLTWQWATRFRGLRRQWRRPANEQDSNYARLSGTTHFAYEPRLERELGLKAKDEKGRGQGRRTHWPRRLP